MVTQNPTCYNISRAPNQKKTFVTSFLSSPLASWVVERLEVAEIVYQQFSEGVLTKYNIVERKQLMIYLLFVKNICHLHMVLGIE